MRKNCVVPLPLPHTMYEINSKWTKDLNVTNKTTKFLEENIKVNLHDLGLGKRFLDMTPTA